MKTIARSHFFLGLIAMIGLAVSSCKPPPKPAPAPPTTLTATVAGRDVRAVIEGSGSVVSTNDTATFTFSSQTVVVEKDRVLHNGKEVIKMLPTLKHVLITWSGGEVKVSATVDPQ